MKYTIDELWDIYLSYGERALTMNQYQLAKESENGPDPISAQDWRKFIALPDVKKFIQEEMEVINSQAVNSMIMQAPTSRSVGNAQAINTLRKVQEEDTETEPETFVYCYTPPNCEQVFSTKFRNSLEMESLSVEQQKVYEEQNLIEQLKSDKVELQDEVKQLKKEVEQYSKEKIEWKIGDSLGLTNG